MVYLLTNSNQMYWKRKWVLVWLCGSSREVLELQVATASLAILAFYASFNPFLWVSCYEEIAQSAIPPQLYTSDNFFWQIFNSESWSHLISALLAWSNFLLCWNMIKHFGYMGWDEKDFGSWLFLRSSSFLMGFRFLVIPFHQEDSYQPYQWNNLPPF